jgi:hypothetical protein
MLNENINSFYKKNDEFFAFAMNAEYSDYIVHYSNLDREITIDNDGSLKLGGTKQRSMITTIDGLCETVKVLINEAEQLLNYEMSRVSSNEALLCFGKKPCSYFDIRSSDIEPLINQIVIDVLYYKYLGETEMTFFEYCEKYSFSLRGDSWVKSSDLEDDASFQAKDAMYKLIKNRVKKEHKRFEKASSHNEFIELGICPDLYIEHITQKRQKMTMDFWAGLYYDTILFPEILKGYYTRKNDNGDIHKELNKYDKFVEKAFIPSDNGKDYFHKTMSYLNLESSYRLEFTYKLAERMSKNNVDSIDNCNFILAKNQAVVCVPTVIVNGKKEELIFYKKKLKYNSMPLIYKAWLNESGYKVSDMSSHNPFYLYNWLNFIRIQTYELFQYHYQFLSDDYCSISDFIKEKYNLLEEYIDTKKNIRA